MSIVLAATPIGNDGDASPRLRSELARADVIAAEDTRRLRALAGRLGVQITGHVLSYHEHNEAEVAPQLAERGRSEHVLVVSDAGMPVVSDPGYRLVALAAAQGVNVSVVPGPSAVLTALALSGLATDRFCFEGFLPRKAGERARRLASLASEPRTMVFFESPRRVGPALAAMAEAFGGDRRAALCRELTKTHEEVRRATLSELAGEYAQGTLGEVALVVEGARAQASEASTGAVDEVLALAEAGLRLKDAAAHVAQREGLSRRELYEAAITARTA